jgi:LysM repeat protein
MKWKDSDEMAGNEEQSGEEFFDEESYSPWNERKDAKAGRRINRPSILVILLILAIVALVAALLMLLWGGSGNMTTRQTVRLLEERVSQLEEHLDKYEGLDEKVTRIWEQAKSYEKFKDRFERSEASTTLRMDHLTMSLETLQKQFTKLDSTSTAPEEKPVSQGPAPSAVRYHEVAPGETFFSISKKYDLSVEDLMRMNEMTSNDVLKIGQKLIVGGITKD